MDQQRITRSKIIRHVQSSFTPSRDGYLTLEGLTVTPHQLTTIVIRLFVLWYAIFLIRELPPSFSAKLEHTGTIAPAMIGVAIVLVLLAIIFWFGASFVARFIIPHSETQIPTPWTQSQVLTVGSSLIGVWVISYSLRPIIYYGTLWFMSRDISGWEVGHTVSLVSALCVLVIGVWLFLGARGLWQVWAKLRGRSEN
ncbi:MAG: hypothetical protein HY018_12770 [Hydrogenophilales bacterium]|nr:hypothetical protein [Hydrogenophilales bacterium]